MPSIQDLYDWAIQKCNEPNIGYSLTYRNQQTVGGITYYDCSSFVWYALIAGGFDPATVYGSTYPFVTADMEGTLLALGYHRYDATLYPWNNGDIMWVSGHCEIVYDAGNYYTMGAHDADRPLADQVSIAYVDNRNYFTYGYHYTERNVDLMVISAICGNWWTESVLNPGAWQGYVVGGAGYGLGQWTDVPAAGLHRRTDLFNWLYNNGYSNDDGDGQLNYFMPANENYWTSSTGNYSRLYNNLQQFLDYVPPSQSMVELENLTYAFQQGWEGLETPQSIRYSNAVNVYNYLLANADTAPRQPWIKGNYPLSTAEGQSNALLIYDFFNGSSPTPPVPPPSQLPDYIKAILTLRRKWRQHNSNDSAKRHRTILL